MNYRRWIGFLLVAAMTIMNLNPADLMRSAAAETEAAEAIPMPLSELTINDIVVVADGVETQAELPAGMTYENDTLTLNGAVGESWIGFTGDLTILVNGRNELNTIGCEKGSLTIFGGQDAFITCPFIWLHQGTLRMENLRYAVGKNLQPEDQDFWDSLWSQGDISITNCTVDLTKETGIYTSDGSVSIDDSEIVCSRISGYAGIRIDNSDITYDDVHGEDDWPLFCDSGILRIHHSTLRGAGAYAKNGILIEDSTMADMAHLTYVPEGNIVIRDSEVSSRAGIRTGNECGILLENVQGNLGNRIDPYESIGGDANSIEIRGCDLKFEAFGNGFGRAMTGKSISIQDSELSISCVLAWDNPNVWQQPEEPDGEIVAPIIYCDELFRVENTHISIDADFSEELPFYFHNGRFVLDHSTVECASNRANATIYTSNHEQPSEIIASTLTVNGGCMDFEPGVRIVDSDVILEYAQGVGFDSLESEVINSRLTIHTADSDEYEHYPTLWSNGSLICSGSTIDLSASLENTSALSCNGDALFSDCDIRMTGVERGLEANNYCNVSFVGCTGEISGKTGIESNMSYLTFAGGDLRLAGSEAALISNTREEADDDAVFISAANDVEGGELCAVNDWINVRSFVNRAPDNNSRDALLAAASKEVRIVSNGNTDAGIMLLSDDIAVGMYLDVVTTYVLGVDNAALAWRIPEELELIPVSVMDNGVAPEIRYENGVLEMTTSQPVGSVRFRLIGAKEGVGDLTVSAKVGDEWIEKDSKRIACTMLSLGLPTKTSRTTLNASGKAVPNSKLEIYDNGSRIAQVQTNQIGWFSTPITLHGTDARHGIHAVITTSDGKKYTTKPCDLEYDPICADIQKLTITNLIHGEDINEIIEHETVVDFANPSAVQQDLVFYPSYPALTFEAEIDNCADPLGLGQVVVVTRDFHGNESRVPLSYDAVRHLWTGSAEYTEYSLPRSVSVGYTGGNYGSIVLGDTEMKYRLEADGRIRIGDDDAGVYLSDDAHSFTIADLNGNAASIELLDENTLVFKNTNGSQSLRITNGENCVTLFDGETEVYLASDGNTASISNSRNQSRMEICGDTVRKWIDDGNGHVTGYVGDDREGTISYPDGTAEKMVSSEDGASCALTARDGSKTVYRMDDQGRITAVESADGESRVAYQEDREIYTQIDGTETIVQRDENGNVREIRYADGQSVSYAYDEENRLSAITDPMGNHTAYTYDTEDRLVSVAYNGSVVVEYAYTADGQLLQRKLGNGAYTDYAFDAQNGAQELRNMLADGTVQYTERTLFNETGLMVGKDGSDGSWTMEYDEAGQLRSMTGANGETVSYQYTPSGTVQTRTAGSVKTEYVSNALNQITAVDDEAYTYDLNGRLIARDGIEGHTAYTWNAMGQLTGVELPDGTVYTYGYDVFGNRDRISVNGETTRYIWTPGDFPALIGAILPDGSYVGYIQGNGMEAIADDTRIAYYQYDLLGSTVAVLDGSGAICNTYAYDPEGSLLSANETVANAFRYVGKYGVCDDGNGLMYMRNRYLNERTRAFISPDAKKQAHDVNLYRYADNNRVQKIDPTGYAGHWEIRKVTKLVRRKEFVPLGSAPKPAPEIDVKGALDDFRASIQNPFKDFLADNPDPDLPEIGYIPDELIDGMYDAEALLHEIAKWIDPLGGMMQELGDEGLYDSVSRAKSVGQYGAPFLKIVARTIMEGVFKTPSKIGVVADAAAIGGVGMALLWYEAAIGTVNIMDALSALAILGMEGYNDMAFEINNWANNFGESITPFIEAAANAYDDSLDTVFDAVYSGYEDAVNLKNAIEGGMEAIGNSVKNTIDAARESADEFGRQLPDNLEHMTGDLIDNAVDSLMNGAEDRFGMPPALKEALGDWAKESLKEKANAQIDKLRQPNDIEAPDEQDLASVEFSDLVVENGQLGYWMWIEEWVETEEEVWVEDSDPDSSDPDPAIETEEPPFENETNEQEVPSSLDPSGYVFDAVENNRIAGVTAKLYYKPTIETPDADAVLWDAEAHGQQNPQVTDMNGCYAWMVGDGWYRVEFIKEGYDTAYSDWVPVPPVQTEVNVEMVSREAPAVRGISASPYCVDVTFTRYIDLDQFSNEQIQLTRADGATVDCDYEAMDGQLTADHRACARNIRVYPHEPFADGETLTLCFTNIVSTAGINADFLQCEAQAHPEIGDIRILDGQSCATDEETVLLLQLLNTEGYPIIIGENQIDVNVLIGMELCGGISANADGTIRIPYKATKAGESVIGISLPEWGWKENIRVHVENGNAPEASYIERAATAREWFSQLMKTWTDGMNEDQNIADGYILRFKAQSDAIRIMLSAETDRAEIELLDEWDAKVEELLNTRINSLFTSDEQKWLHDVLFQRVDMAVRYSDPKDK